VKVEYLLDPSSACLEVRPFKSPKDIKFIHLSLNQVRKHVEYPYASFAMLATDSRGVNCEYLWRVFSFQNNR
jgi:hypothetical protein